MDESLKPKLRLATVDGHVIQPQTYAVVDMPPAKCRARFFDQFGNLLETIWYRDVAVAALEGRRRADKLIQSKWID